MIRREHRTSVLLLAVFQLGVSIGVPVADGRLEFEGATVPIHVESDRDLSCGDGHDHLFCQFCRTIALAAALAEPERRRAAPLPTSPALACPTQRAPVLSPHAASPLGPRAPPLA